MFMTFVCLKTVKVECDTGYDKVSDGVESFKIEYAAGRRFFFTKLKWKIVKKTEFFLLFGLHLENEERYRDGSNG